MIKVRGKINYSDISTKHLNKDFVNKHQGVWDASKKKYEFLDKNVDFKDAVDFSKEILDKQITSMKKEKKLILK